MLVVEQRIVAGCGHLRGFDEPGVRGDRLGEIGGGSNLTGGLQQDLGAVLSHDRRGG